ncbi:MAG: phage holin family protein [Neisseria sp.]|uniref:phage holin family protein n=1 Tax=Neisseria sp. TaxID=192066 RepID=UPI0026DCAC02|nr:phage holin family protein [Neisseria sp.]MDO4641546.1 phage holin family protein [Neisseria sp.]
MGIKQEITGFKNIITQGADLLLLRLRILHLDVGTQAAGLLKILALMAVAAIFCLIALVAVLFGLNTILSPVAKIWVFFGTAVFMALAAVCLLWQIPRVWRIGSKGVGQTLQDMREDLAHLSGKARQNKGEEHV